MKHIEELRNMLCMQLYQIAKKGELTAGSLDTIDKLAHAIKSIDTIVAMEDYSEEDNSSYYDGGSYERGGSYARGRGSDARRDSMGRYSSMGRSYDGYSGDTKEELTRLMNTAQNDREREAIRAALDKMGR